jgi:hypothetical protein
MTIVVANINHRLSAIKPLTIWFALPVPQYV